MICKNTGRSLIIAGKHRIKPGMSITVENCSERDMKAFKYFAAKGIMELIFDEPAAAPAVVEVPVVEAAPVQEVYVEAPAEEAPVVESEVVAESAVSEGGKKRRNRKQ